MIRTPSKIYEAIRKVGDYKYDHIAVVLDKESCLHIAFPYAKKVPTILFAHKSKQPFIIRPKFINED